MNIKSEHKRWGLYWVSSDGDEDCFVVARNSRSAAKADADYCGFETMDASVVRLKTIPPEIIRQWTQRRKREYPQFSLPWYADKWLLKKLGAQFRERDSLSETLIDDVVYSTGSDGPIPPRTIGRKYIKEFQQVKSFKRYGHEDRYSSAQMTLLSLLGICVSRCQEIEHLIAHSFILAAMSPSERKFNRTISETISAWKKKTFGQMIRSIEDGYETDPIVNNCLRLFLEMRNKLIHGLTTSDQFDINTSWGQDEMIAFLSFFELVSRPLREAFKASLYASIDIGNIIFMPDNPDDHIPLTKREKNKTVVFASFFSPRKDFPF
jgi:hypothetical protein